MEKKHQRIMSRNPEDIINFAAGPAKLPREVKDALFLFNDPGYFLNRLL